MIQFIKDFKYRILNFILLSFLAFYSFAYNLPVHIAFAIANAIIIQSLLVLIARHRIVYSVLSVIISLIIGIEVSQVAAFSCRFNYGIIASVFETNKTEAISMFSILYKYLFLYLIVVAVLIFSFKMVRNEQVRKPLRKRWVCLLFLLGWSIISIKSYRFVTREDDFLTLMKTDFENYPLLTANECFFHWTPSFFHTTILVTAYFQEQHKLKKYTTMDQKFPDVILRHDSINSLPNTIFFVIGESSTSKNYSLYGYTTPTTPILDSLYSINKLRFFDALSPASLTRDAVPFITTFGTPHNPELQYTQESIITLAKNLGFETYWISNQDRGGRNDSPIGYVAERSQHPIFQSEEKEYELRDDLHLIDKVKNIYQPNHKQFIVIHLRGSHQAYVNGSDDQDKAHITESNSANSQNLEYDQTIHHTDRVLGGLYHNFFDQDSLKSILFYTSDHGEIVNLGHGFANSNMDQFKVPFIVVGSEYINQVDSIAQKYMNNGILNTVNFPFIFSEIIGYKIKDEAIKTAKEEGLYYKQVDGKILKFRN